MEKRIKRGAGKVVWMDPFDTRCCTKDTLESAAGFHGGDGSWAVDFMSAPEDFVKGRWFRPCKCTKCGRYWFWFKEGYWTVK